MANIEILIIERAAVNAFSSSTIEIREITALAHEPWYDPVEDTPCVAITLFACAECFEIGSRLGHDVSIQTEFNPTKRLSIGSYVKVDSISDFGRCGSSRAAEEVGEEVEGHHVQVVVVFVGYDDVMFG